jgi:(2Fe-2S) ferredoxin
VPITVPDVHLLMCSSSRIAGAPKGGCQGRSAPDLVAYLQEEVSDRGIPGVLVTNTGCLQLCPRGPVLVVYPEGHWYGPIDSQEKIDMILDAIEDGEVVEDLLVTKR